MFQVECVKGVHMYVIAKKKMLKRDMTIALGNLACIKKYENIHTQKNKNK